MTTEEAITHLVNYAKDYIFKCGGTNEDVAIAMAAETQLRKELLMAATVSIQKIYNLNDAADYFLKNNTGVILCIAPGKSKRVDNWVDAEKFFIENNP
jgi:hypothetical protein